MKHSSTTFTVWMAVIVAIVLSGISTVGTTYAVVRIVLQGETIDFLGRKMSHRWRRTQDSLYMLDVEKALETQLSEEFDHEVDLNLPDIWDSKYDSDWTPAVSPDPFDAFDANRESP